jgi:hypothetical protein
MRRIFGLLSILSAGLGLFLLLSGSDGSSGTGAAAMQSAPVAYGGWAAGLCMGLCLAWLSGVNWSELPQRVYGWLRVQGRRVAWMLLAGAFLGVLIYF